MILPIVELFIFSKGTFPSQVSVPGLLYFLILKNLDPYENSFHLLETHTPHILQPKPGHPAVRQQEHRQPAGVDRRHEPVGARGAGLPRLGEEVPRDLSKDAGG